MKRNTIAITITAFLLLVLVVLFIIPNGIAPHPDIGPNYKNVTVWTRVNITHSKPQVLNVSIYEAQNISNRNITITAGDYKKVYCNATVRDWNGFNDITKVNATLYHVLTSNHSFVDNNNSHYSNTSCILNDSLSAGAPFTGWFVCSFDVLYYANNGLWICNVTVSDNYTVVNSNYTGSGYGNTTFYPVYALNVTDGINYGAAAVEDYTNPDVVANLTNLGNMGINISVEGYGTKKSDGLAMNCSINGNITVDNERFSIFAGQGYNLKTALNASGAINITGLTMPKQTIPGNQVINATYWQLYVNYANNPAGNCTGFIIFTAMIS